MSGSRFESHRLVYALLIAASCALSALAILRDPLINDDGVVYLVLAQTISTQGLAAAFSLFHWPFYPMLIALLHGLTGLPLLASAHLLDAALLALLTVSFARLVALLGGERRFFGWAALTLLLFPQLNEYRSYIVRDFGFWAFLVAALVPLARHQSTQRWQDGAAWAVLIVLAAAFRPEALVFGALLPLAALGFGSPGERITGTLRLYACIGALALLPLLVLARFGQLDALADLVFPRVLGLLSDLGTGFSGAVERYATLVLDRHVEDYAPWSLGAGLLAVLALKFAHTFGLPYAALLGWGLATHRATVPDAGRAVFRTLLASSLLVVCVFLAGRQFLTGRYLIPLCLAALVPCSFAARELVELAQRSRWRLSARAGLALLLLWLLADGFVSFGTRKNYVHESIAWMETQLPPDARVFSNDRLLAFYSGRSFDWTALEGAAQSIPAGTAPLAGVDFWVVHLDGHDPTLAGALRLYDDALTPQARFAGPDGREIVILRRTDRTR